MRLLPWWKAHIRKAEREKDMYIVKVSEQLYPTENEMKVVMVTTDYAKARAYYQSLKRDYTLPFSYIFIGNNDE